MRRVCIGHVKFKESLTREWSAIKNDLKKIKFSQKCGHSDRRHS